MQARPNPKREYTYVELLERYFPGDSLDGERSFTVSRTGLWDPIIADLLPQSVLMEVGADAEISKDKFPT
jgi:hypothetical protein